MSEENGCCNENCLGGKCFAEFFSDCGAYFATGSVSNHSCYGSCNVIIPSNCESDRNLLFWAIAWKALIGICYIAMCVCLGTTRRRQQR